jgi:hypothetical protein
MAGKILTPVVNKALAATKRFNLVEDFDSYSNGATADGQISAAGRQAGVQYVFVIDISPVSVRIVDVELGTELAKISIDGKITVISAALIAKKIVDFILNSTPKPETTEQDYGETASAYSEPHISGNGLSSPNTQAKNALLVDVGPLIAYINKYQVNPFSIGLQYERKLSDYFSLVERYVYSGNHRSSSQRQFSIHYFELDGRWYPTGKTFFLDGKSGYGFGTIRDRYYNYYNSDYHYNKYEYKYFMSGGALGWRIRFGKKGGFTWEIAAGYVSHFGGSSNISGLNDDLVTGITDDRLHGITLECAFGWRF